MFKKYLLISIAILGMISTSGCSLFKSDSDTKEEAVAEDTTSDAAVSDSTEKMAGSDEEEVVDEYPDDDYGDGSSTKTADTSGVSELPDSPVEGTQDETLLVGADDSFTNAPMTAPVQETTAATDTTTTIPDTYVPTPAVSAAPPLKKMKKTPYTDHGTLINRLYVARKGDTMEKVSEKVYGDPSRTHDLTTWNNKKTLKVGDKVYYGSAKNPTDTNMLLYYEEAGLQPTMYTAKKGDSIRKVATTLLGHPRSWMEIWETNEVESKWTLPEGTQLRYWPAGETAAPVQAQAATTEEMPPAPAPEATGAAASVAAGDTAAAPAETAPIEEPAAAPADDTNAAAAAAQASASDVPPPPPPESTAPPPAQIDPPEPPAEKSSGGLSSIMGGGEDDSMMMAVLGGLLIAAALILLVFIRRSRKKVNYG